MRGTHRRDTRVRYVIMVLAVALLSSCSGATEPTVTSTSQPPATTSDAAGAPALDIPGLPELPAEARAGNGLAAPRPAGYWALWNTCAPENRAAEAEANGGRAAGFTLIDDLLLDPGIGLGDYRIDSCEDALAILEAGESAPSGSIERLAAQLLVAELNLLVGSESCPAAEEATVGAHFVLSEAGYVGPGKLGATPPGEAGEALPSFIALVEAYNAGDLCY